MMMIVGASSCKWKWKKEKVPVTKHDIILPKAPSKVEFEGSLLGLIDNLKYADHDCQDLEKFLGFTMEMYM